MSEHDADLDKTRACMEALKQAIDELERMQGETDELVAKLRRELAEYEAGQELATPKTRR